jgi:hypothetical protein
VRPRRQATRRATTTQRRSQAKDGLYGRRRATTH